MSIFIEIEAFLDFVTKLGLVCETRLMVFLGIFLAGFSRVLKKILGGFGWFRHKSEYCRMVSDYFGVFHLLIRTQQFYYFFGKQNSAKKIQGERETHIKEAVNLEGNLVIDWSHLCQEK